MGIRPAVAKGSHVLPGGEVEHLQGTTATDEQALVGTERNTCAAVHTAAEFAPPDLAPARQFPQTGLVVLVTEGEQVAAVRRKGEPADAGVAGSDDVVEP